jgi:cytoskeletal protein CcmA (bactofilin family)
MAIFGRNDNKKSAAAIKKWATTIAYGTQIKGEIVLTSSLHIDGEFEGTIHSDHVITISTQGRVIGDIIAKGIIINGLFRGSMMCQHFYGHKIKLLLATFRNQQVTCNHSLNDVVYGYKKPRYISGTAIEAANMPQKATVRYSQLMASHKA